jgi:hypothetical protein
MLLQCLASGSLIALMILPFSRPPVGLLGARGAQQQPRRHLFRYKIGVREEFYWATERLPRKLRGTCLVA